MSVQRQIIPTIQMQTEAVEVFNEELITKNSEIIGKAVEIMLCEGNITN